MLRKSLPGWGVDIAKFDDFSMNLSDEDACRKFECVLNK